MRAVCTETSYFLDSRRERHATSWPGSLTERTLDRPGYVRQDGAAAVRVICVRPDGADSALGNACWRTGFGEASPELLGCCRGREVFVTQLR